MMVLLGLAGALVAFGIGVAVGRSGRRTEPPEPRQAPAPARPSYADLIDDHPVGVLVADPAGKVEYRNKAALGLQGTHIGVLVDEAIERHIELGLEGTASDEVLELYGPPKTVLVVDAHPTPNGGAVVFVEDISERRRIDQIRTDFVANISHELKTPVGALSVLAETLEEETDQETTQRVVRRMMGEASRASRTIDDLMELSRIELGGERTIEAVRVADLVDTALGRVTELAKQRNIRISLLDAVDPHGSRPDTSVISGDRRQLTSALGNLVENAVKYSEPGGLVQVRSRRDGNWVELMVIDQGVGIPQRDLDRIFERFYRVDRARSRGTGGTGLGLSIVRHVATNHDGEVLVTSTEGEGSTFVLRLPAAMPSSDHQNANEHDEGVA
ncbi:MAG: ATP-binding protein [Ilumatobacter sp.]|uniref:sensor histidine kinase n=1 Tax=Ilumatobacter sp. TaxID=1967498 RepID=UPI002632C0E2|nr:ATP-binding protein [Ilumatobacter sp.]MDJ0771225.1 ATP-binding protein [Ilumatobacter sp.]